MGYDKRVYAAAREELARRRYEASTQAQAHLDEIHQKIPEIRQIDRELSMTGISVARAVIGRGNSHEKIEQLRRQNLQLQQRRASLLRQAGYPEDYTQEHYHCPKCRDTGVLGTKYCGCYQALLREKACELLNQTSPIQLSSFDTFHTEYYPNLADKNGISPRQTMTAIYQYCLSYAQNFSAHSKSILMMGATGLGKTHLSLAIAHAVIDKGYGVIYGSAQNLLSTLEKERFSRASSDMDSLQILLDCDLLILDDLGAEFPTQFVSSSIYNIVNSRLGAGKPMIINTNLTPIELRERYTDRIVSRIVGTYEILTFTGSDIRQFLRRQQREL